MHSMHTVCTVLLLYCPAQVHKKKPAWGITDESLCSIRVLKYFYCFSACWKVPLASVCLSICTLVQEEWGEGSRTGHHWHKHKCAYWRHFPNLCSTFGIQLLVKVSISLSLSMKHVHSSGNEWKSKLSTSLFDHVFRRVKYKEHRCKGWSLWSLMFHFHFVCWCQFVERGF